MMGIHGGDIYKNHVLIDFSVNINPLGIPKSVKDVLHETVEMCIKYPDMEEEKLKKAVSNMLAVPKESILFGNGASQLFMGVVHSIKPKKTVIPVPSFYGYEYAAKAAGGEIIYYETRKENAFQVTKDFYKVLTEDVDLLFLANPNNPTGNLLSKEDVKELLGYCRDRDIYVVLDESFIEFCGREFSILTDIEKFHNLILIRSFTKIFSIPGVRLGYLICNNYSLLYKIQRQLPEWNLSCFAQEAGCTCAREIDFMLKTKDYIKKERPFLENGLKQKGFSVFTSMANFIFFYSEKPLYEGLLKKGILIRDCRNFRGLWKGFYRIAVKNRKENEILLKEIGERTWEK